MFSWDARENGGVSSILLHLRTALRLICGTSDRKDLCMVPCHSWHIYGIWNSRSKKVWGILKSHQLWVVMQVRKWGTLFTGKTPRHYVILLYCETLLQILLSINCKRFCWIPLFTLYYCCFTCLRLAKPRVQLKVSKSINTEWAIPEIFFSFLLCPWKFHIVNPPPSPLWSFFFCIIVFVL